MNDLTAHEILIRRQWLENAAASCLGHMLFEFSRLEVNVGLCLVWLDGGARLDSLTSDVQALSLKAKLDALTRQVDAKLPAGSKGRRAYKAWVQRVDSARRLRNNLVHGRWGIDTMNGKVVNVLGLPTSDAQQSTEYTPDELADFVRELQSLQKELWRLRDHWPL